jgi:HUS1 checkpoint protein
MDFIFENYHIQSAESANTINLELPLGVLQRALKSASNATHAALRLTKRDGLPMLSLTVHTVTRERVSIPSLPSHGSTNSNGYVNGNGQYTADPTLDPSDPFASVADDPYDDDGIFQAESLELTSRANREKVITQDIPVRVLHPETVETIMQPKVREPDVHINLPPLMQLKAIADRFTKLAASTAAAMSGGLLDVGGSRGGAGISTSLYSHKLELSANMHGSLRLRLKTDQLDLVTQWNNLENPKLDEAQLNVPLAEHPSTKFREAGPERWATVRVDGRDWSKVLSVGRLDGRVIACFADEHALILYVYVPQYDDASAEDSVVTVSLVAPSRLGAIAEGECS